MKIPPDHLVRGAFSYIGQPTVDQLANNHESRRRQYGLANRARNLGWSDTTVIGDHTSLTVRKNRRGQTRWVVGIETIDLIRTSARLMPDKAIAGMLNQTGKRTSRQNGRILSRACGFRNMHSVAVYKDGE